MKRLKKLITLALTLCVLTVAFSGCIQPKTYTPSDENLFEFVLLDNGSYSVAVKAGATLPETVYLPKTYNEKAVTVVAAGAFIGSGVKNVCIPSNIKTVGENAFYGCESLESVYFYKGVEEIQAGAFYNCKGLKELNLPSSLKVIGNSAFCNISISRLKLTEKVESVGEFAFAYCGDLISVYISHSVSSLASNAFVGINEKAEFEISASNAYYKLDENGLPVAR